MMNGTTIVAVKKGEKVAIAGDGQVTMGNKTIMKSTDKNITIDAEYVRKRLKIGIQQKDISKYIL
jgi:ATP-dependent protease HslVU (ClpYQ) peptidase subunit